MNLKKFKKDNLIGFEKRVDKINNRLNNAKEPTLEFVVINDKEYSRIEQFPIIIRYDVENSKVYGHCDLVGKVEVPYWKLKQH